MEDRMEDAKCISGETDIVKPHINSLAAAAAAYADTNSYRSFWAVIRRILLLLSSTLLHMSIYAESISITTELMLFT